MGNIQSRIIQSYFNGNTITSMQAVYVPADDLTDFIPVSIFSQLDVNVTLSRLLIFKGIYPSINILESSSNILTDNYVCICYINIIMLLKF